MESYPPPHLLTILLAGAATAIFAYYYRGFLGSRSPVLAKIIFLTSSGAAAFFVSWGFQIGRGNRLPPLMLSVVVLWIITALTQIWNIKPQSDQDDAE